MFEKISTCYIVVSMARLSSMPLSRPLLNKAALMFENDFAMPLKCGGFRFSFFFEGSGNEHVISRRGSVFLIALFR